MAEALAGGAFVTACAAYVAIQIWKLRRAPSPAYRRIAWFKAALGVAIAMAIVVRLATEG
jgi:hypothetical protein